MKENIIDSTLTDMRNAREFVKDHEGQVIYVPGIEWLEYDGLRWRPTSREAMEARAKDTLVRMLNDGGRLSPDKGQAQLGHAVKSMSNSKIRAMLEVAKSEPTILVEANGLDGDPLLFNCESGVINLETGDLLEHAPELYLTRLAPVAFDPEAICPLWDYVVGRVLPDEEVAAYWHQALGYALTGKITAQAAFFPFGDGANGKTVLMLLPYNIMGDYAQSVRAGVLIQKNSSGNRNEIADLMGVRLAWVNEYPENKPLDEAMVKTATGGESMVGRKLYKDAFSFVPQFKMFVPTNHKPIIKGTDEGIWRRVKVIEFGVTIPKDERDERLADPDMSSNPLWEERSGILNRMLAGCREFLDHGLDEPRAVTLAVQEYRDDMDLLKHFLDAATVADSGGFVYASDLYQTYRAWAKSAGHYPVNQARFGREISKKLTKGRCPKGTGKVTYQDIAIDPEWAPPEGFDEVAWRV